MSAWRASSWLAKSTTLLALVTAGKEAAGAGLRGAAGAGLRGAVGAGLRGAAGARAAAGAPTGETVAVAAAAALGGTTTGAPTGRDAATVGSTGLVDCEKALKGRAPAVPGTCTRVTTGVSGLTPPTVWGRKALGICGCCLGPVGLSIGGGTTRLESSVPCGSAAAREPLLQEPTSTGTEPPPAPSTVQVAGRAGAAGASCRLEGLLSRAALSLVGASSLSRPRTRVFFLSSSSSATMPFARTRRWPRESTPKTSKTTGSTWLSAPSSPLPPGTTHAATCFRSPNSLHSGSRYFSILPLPPSTLASQLRISSSGLPPSSVPSGPPPPRSSRCRFSPRRPWLRLRVPPRRCCC
mmetsp:Transcript_36231/g.112811  ORF Transcript_36231/g.112811 Transcript_36231/m.112811 type:complete len:352 (-) Transcript_36231:496-1551(-)